MNTEDSSLRLEMLLCSSRLYVLESGVRLSMRAICRAIVAVKTCVLDLVPFDIDGCAFVATSLDRDGALRHAFSD